MGGGSWLYFLFYTMLNYWEFGQIWLTGGAVIYMLSTAYKETKNFSIRMITQEYLAPFSS